MKLRNKGLLTLGSLAAIAAPMLAVVSCGSIGHHKERTTLNANGKYAGITLRLGMRLDEASFIKPAIHEFERATGAIVEYEGATPSTYSTSVSSRSGLADVTLVEGEDTNVSSQKGGWFAPFTMNELLTNEKYNDIEYKNGYELNKSVDLTDNTQIDVATIKSANWKASINNRLAYQKKSNYLPVVFGPRLIFGWRHDIAGKDLYDGKTDLKWYVPKAITNTSGINGLEEVTFSSSDPNQNPLLKADGTHYKNTPEDVKDFLLNSARESQRKFNQTSYTRTNLTDADAHKRLIATGQEGYKQRLYSVVNSLKHSSTGFALGQAGILEYSSIDIAMIANGMSSILRAKDDNKIAYDQNAGIVDDKKWATGFPGATSSDAHLWNVGQQLNTNNASDPIIKMWLGQFGYLNNYTVALKQLLSVGEESLAFASHKTSFFNGQKWLQPTLLSVTHTPLDNTSISKKFVSFPEPFSDPGVDGYAVKGSLTGTKKDAAFALLRFMLQEKVQSEMVGSKTLPIVTAARQRILSSGHASIFDQTAASSGFTTIPVNDRLSGGIDIVSRASSDNVLNKLSIKAEKMNWDTAATSNRITWSDYIARFEDVRNTWQRENAVN